MIKFGVAGYPPAFAESSYKKNRIDILRWLADLDIDALELQMTYGPRTSPDTCREYRALAEDKGISLSIHAAYFIVFTSDNAEKVEQSLDTLKRTYELADILGSKTIVLHPGPLYGGNPDDAMDRFTENMTNFVNDIGPTDIGLFAETAGKTGQLGSVDEILQLSKSVPGVYPCIDFGHVHARTLGGLEEPKPIYELVEHLCDFIHSQEAPRMHFHYTPIHFGPKGEKQHRAIYDRYPAPDQKELFGKYSVGEYSQDGFYHPRFEPVAEALRMINIDCTVISETRNSQEVGALALKHVYEASAGTIYEQHDPMLIAASCSRVRTH